MRVAYERVSTAGQSTLRQDVMMQNQNIEKVFTEKISGKNRNRPELEKMLDFVREGDGDSGKTERLFRANGTFISLKTGQVVSYDAFAHTALLPW